jgi:SET domain-containing protein
MSHLIEKVEVRDAGPTGRGVFAVAPIAKGETVVGFGGWMCDKATLSDLSSARARDAIQVDDDLFLVGPNRLERADMVNHSCAPTCGLRGSVVLVAMRDLAPGEEITMDFATCDSEAYDEFECECGAESCRHKITGRDWELPELQRRYRGWFSTYLARRIAAAQPPHASRRAFAA